MRITGNRLIDLATASTASSQSQVADLAQQVSSGLRVSAPSQDPTAWLAAHRDTLRRSLSQGTGVAMQFSRDRLDETDRALATIQDAISSAHALAVQGANDTYNADSRRALALQVRSMFDAARAAANTRSADGEYLLAGSTSLNEPFDASGAYLGDADTRAVPTTEDGTSVITLSGTELTAASGVDILPLLGKVADALAANDPKTLTSLMPDLDTALNQLSRARGRGGAAMAVLDSAQQAHSQLEQNLSQSISNYVETDTVAAASDLAKATQALDASRTVSQHVIALLNRVTST